MFSNITLKNALQEGTSRLINHVENPQKEVRLLLEYTQNLTQIQLMLNEESYIDARGFLDLVDKRAKNIPLEYLTHSASFYSRDFFTDYGALIPRPETEILIDKVLPFITKNDKVIDIGTGSGIIAITLCLELNMPITATDISDKALRIAHENVKKFKLEDKITFIQSDLFENIENTYDVIVSNPPYIADDYEIPQNLHHEPQNALFGGTQGDEILKRLIDASIAHGARILCFEMGYDQKEPLSHYLNTQNINNYTFYQDLSGFDRGCCIRLLA